MISIIFFIAFLFLFNGASAQSSSIDGNACVANRTQVFSNLLKLELDSRVVNIGWTVDCAQQVMHFNVTTQVDGWFAIGFNDRQGMAGGDVYQMAIDPNGAPMVRNSKNDGYDPKPNQAIAGGVAPGFLIDVRSAQVDGLTSFAFSRSFQAVGSQFGFTDNVYEYYLLIARRAASADFDRMHDDGVNGRRFSAKKINWLGKSQIANVGGPIHVVYYAHLGFMFFAWLVLVPINIFFARFLKTIGHQWFLIHRTGGFVVVLFSLIGAFCAYLYVDETGGVHFTNSKHQLIGLIVVIVSVLQVILGLVADWKFDHSRQRTPLFPDQTHMLVGVLLTIAAATNVVLGVLKALGGVSFALIVVVFWLVMAAGYLFAGQYLLGVTDHKLIDDKRANVHQLWKKVSKGFFVLGLLALAAFLGLQQL